MLPYMSNCFVGLLHNKKLHSNTAILLFIKNSRFELFFYLNIDNLESLKKHDPSTTSYFLIGPMKFC